MDGTGGAVSMKADEIKAFAKARVEPASPKCISYL